MNTDYQTKKEPLPEDLAASDDRFSVNAFGFKIEVMSNAERIANGYAPIPENFICCCEPHGPRLVACADDAL
ncbi:MAG TPA: hypothetical protein DDZ88_30670 [Verrucomicrobiales bacterium]|nr:hypothetical protein [Verrucomicrobiales bacterium]